MLRRVLLGLLVLLPWIAYFGLVLTAWWLIGFDGTASTDTTGWLLLALAVPALFVAGQVSRWERAKIRARFEGELLVHRPPGAGGIWDKLMPW